MLLPSLCASTPAEQSVGAYHDHLTCVFLDFLCFFVAIFLFCAFLPSFPRILAVPQREEPLVFFGGGGGFFPPNSARVEGSG